MSLDSSYFRANLRADPLSRCAALSLPMDAIAILPFFQTQAELEMPEQEQEQPRSCRICSLENPPLNVFIQRCAIFPELYS